MVLLTFSPAAQLNVATCRAQQLQFALNMTAAVLPAFEQLFGVPFTLPKLDLVAIPDFAAGAMENWGLITYRCAAFLVSAPWTTWGSSPTALMPFLCVRHVKRVGGSSPTGALPFLCLCHGELGAHHLEVRCLSCLCTLSAAATLRSGGWCHGEVGVARIGVLPRTSEEGSICTDSPLLDGCHSFCPCGSQAASCLLSDAALTGPFTRCCAAAHICLAALQLRGHCATLYCVTSQVWVKELGFRVRHLLCRETALLVDPASASIQDYRYVSNVIAHEMTHQVGAVPGWPCF